MIIGETLLSESETGATYYSPWFPLGGNMAAFTAEVIAVASGSNLSSFKVQVQTKNQDDADADATDLLGSPQTITATAGAFTKFNAGAQLDSGSAGMKELVRFEYTVTAASGKMGWVHFRMLNPSWLSN